MAKTKFDKRTDFEIDNAKRLVSIRKKQKDLDFELLDIQTRSGKLDEEAVKRVKQKIADNNQLKKVETQRKKDLKETRNEAKTAGDKAKEIGDAAEKFMKSAPGGGLFVKALGLENLGDRMQRSLIQKIQKSTLATKGLGMATKALMGPLGIVIGAAGILFAAFRGMRSAARDLGQDLNVSTKQAQKLLIPLKAQELKFKALGLSSENLKTTLGSIADEFGSLENVTAANAANVERLALNTGTSGKEIVSFNKVMMDLTGSSFNVATNMAQTAANMAKSANVATGKVLSDMSSNAEAFARFSMDGANGLAKAAIEAAKVGSSLTEVVKAADSLLEFESSITAQFKAQVLTGKQINTERARQLALDGDIAGLTQEIQSIVGGVGDIQSLNVIQRKSVADAIGISVADLLKISRGEQAQQQETVQDKLSITNKLLAAGNEEATKILLATEDNKTINMNQTTY